MFDHNDSSGLGYIVKPPGSPARVHEHLDVGAGQLDLDAIFAALAAVGFDGNMTSCVLSEERRAVDSVHHVHKAIPSLAERSGPVRS